MYKTDICSLTLPELEVLLTAQGEKSYRALQLYQWIHKKLAADFSEMTDLSKLTRAKLAETCTLTAVKMRKKISAARGDTAKYLFELENNTIIESVLMKYSYGNAVCVSSQAGCAMGCVFCASGADGLDRSLTAGEMCAQVYEIQKDAGRISNIVIMGSGEPLANFDNTIRFIRIINSPEGLGLGQRHITLSTCGLPEKIRELAGYRFQLTLAVSLHAPNDGIRQRLMPVARRYPMDQLLAACGDYSRETGRRVTYEYALMSGINDSRKDAAELSKRLKNTMSHVNLIPVNDVANSSLRRSGKERIEAFANVLLSKGIETTIRRELGSDINAACGQLRGIKIKTP